MISWYGCIGVATNRVKWGDGGYERIMTFIRGSVK